jgi:hypothetical protein
MLDYTVYILLLFWHQISHFFFRGKGIFREKTSIPVLTFLKYRYYTGPGIENLIPNWKHYMQAMLTRVYILLC